MDDRKRRVAMLGSAALAMAAASAWGIQPMRSIRNVSIKTHVDSEEIQAARISAAEAKRQRRAERNRKLMCESDDGH